ncbi:hypothetical protein GGS24DRAFT_488134 [Hypoxylon argillaceum]|nr:hypothetical protein GGS24DRAFT_488134 [Hypoxylon argillaceum]
MALLVSEYVIRCLQDFQAASSESHELTEAARHKILDEFARFKLWAGNIGAHRTGRSSLEWRLRDASHLRDLVVNLLTDLKNALQDRHRNNAPILETPSGLDDIDEVDNDAEILEIAAEIGDIVGCLLRLSVSIRNPAPHDHFMSSKFIDTSYFEEYDVEHVKTKLLNVDPVLAHRLGKAISRRRQYFKYRETHHQKLNAGLDLDSTRSEAGVQSTVASSIPTALKDSKNTWPSSNRLEEEEIEANYGPFECPFCYMMISISTTIQWKKHVYADLRPYICLELDCSTPEQQYTKRHEWLEHLSQKHWRAFRCPYSCNAADFASSSQLESHIRQSHPELSSQRDLGMIFDLCERPMAWPKETKCPLCLKTLYSKREYGRHVGRHQTELALFALPNKGEEIEEEGSQNDDSDNNAHRSNRDEYLSEDESNSGESELGDALVFPKTCSAASLAEPGARSARSASLLAGGPPFIYQECGQSFDRVHKLRYHDRLHLDRHVQDTHMSATVYYCPEPGCVCAAGGSTFL